MPSVDEVVDQLCRDLSADDEGRYEFSDITSALKQAYNSGADAVRSFVAAERDACENLAFRFGDEDGYDASTSRAIAAAIRDRGSP